MYFCNRINTKMTAFLIIFFTLFVICEVNKFAFSFYTFRWVEQHKGLWFLVADDSPAFELLENETARTLSYHMYGMPFYNIKAFKEFLTITKTAFSDFIPDYLLKMNQKDQTPANILKTLIAHNDEEIALYAIFCMFTCDVEYTADMVPDMLTAVKDKEMFKSFIELVSQGYGDELAAHFVGEFSMFLVKNGADQETVLNLVKILNRKNETKFHKNQRRMTKKRKEELINETANDLEKELRENGINEYDRMAAQMFENGMDMAAYRFLAKSIEGGVEEIEWHKMCEYIAETEDPFAIATDQDIETIRQAMNEALEKEEEFDAMLMLNQKLTKNNG